MAKGRLMSATEFVVTQTQIRQDLWDEINIEIKAQLTAAATETAASDTGAYADRLVHATRQAMVNVAKRHGLDWR